MYSTPIETSYYDNPAGNNEYLKSLTPHDHTVYTRGYIQACYQFMESLTDTKNSFLNAALKTESDEPAKARLLAHVKLLDMLDEAVSERVQLLRAME